jgi:hypothetical protein
MTLFKDVLDWIDSLPEHDSNKLGLELNTVAGMFHIRPYASHACLCGREFGGSWRGIKDLIIQGSSLQRDLHSETVGLFVCLNCLRGLMNRVAVKSSEGL